MGRGGMDGRSLASEELRVTSSYAHVRQTLRARAPLPREHLARSRFLNPLLNTLTTMSTFRGGRSKKSGISLTIMVRLISLPPAGCRRLLGRLPSRARLSAHEHNNPEGSRLSVLLPRQVAGSSGSGRTTFVNTLCEQQVLKGLDVPDAKDAHLESQLQIKPSTVGASALPLSQPSSRIRQY